VKGEVVLPEGFRVIGLLGAAGSGKDLVADWLCNRGFVKVAFSDSLKRFAKKVFDIPEVNLWGPSEKRGEVVTVDGELFHNSNKLTMFIREWGEEILDRWGIHKDRERDFLHLVAEWFYDMWSRFPDGMMSVRIVLQTLGTEMGRRFDDKLWTRYMYEDVLPLLAKGHFYTQTAGVLHEKVGWAGAVIPDHRFLNEVNETRYHGHEIYKLVRLVKKTEKVNVGIKGHASEKQMEEIPDAYYTNILEFPEGVEAVHSIIKTAFRMDKP